MREDLALATSWPPNPGWQLRFDNPDLRGWTVVAAYLIAAVCCARRASAKGESSPGIWRLLATILFFLGVNKQLNLQTLLIDLARRASLAGGWYKQRRMVQEAFCAILGLAGLTVLWFMRIRFRRFFAQNPWALCGLVLLFFFVIFRAASINHIFQSIPFLRDDKQWTWLMELGGSACLTAAAWRARSST